MVGVSGRVITSVKAKYRCISDVSRYNAFIAKLINDLVNNGFGGRVRILGITKYTFKYLHSTGLARFVYSVDTDAMDMVPNNRAKKMFNCDGEYYKVASNPALMN